MKRSFLFQSWTLARLCSGAALAMTMFATASAGAAILTNSISDYRMSTVRNGSELLVDWNQDFIVHQGVNSENLVRPELPSLSPDEPLAADDVFSAAEIAGNESSHDDASGSSSEEKVADNDSAAATEENSTTENTASDESNTNGDNFSDYYRFKFGRFAEQYGNNADTPSPDSKPDTPPTFENSANDTASKNDAAAKSDETTTDGESTDNGSEDSTTPNADTNASEAGKTDGSSKTDTTNKTSDDLNYTQPENFGHDDSRYHDYYRYRNEPIDGRYGENKDADSQEEATPSDSELPATDESNEEVASNEQNANDESASNEDKADGSTMADAMLTVVSLWADDFSANHGINMTQVMNMLGQIK